MLNAENFSWPPQEPGILKNAFAWAAVSRAQFLQSFGNVTAPLTPRTEAQARRGEPMAATRTPLSLWSSPPYAFFWCEEPVCLRRLHGTFAVPAPVAGSERLFVSVADGAEVAPQTLGFYGVSGVSWR